MNDAILEAANMFGNPQPGDVIYAITDGFDNESHSSSAKVLQYLEQRNIRLFVSAIDNPGWMHYSRYTGGPESVGKIAKETGGYYIILGTDRPRKSAPATSTNALHQLYALMASFYLLDVVVPKDRDKPRELKLVVTEPNGNQKKDAIILYPQKVFPCSGARYQKITVVNRQFHQLSEAAIAMEGQLPLSLLNMRTAWRRVKDDITNRVFIRHPYSVSLVDSDLDGWLDAHLEMIRTDEYVPDSAFICDVPKENGLVRPGMTARFCCRFASAEVDPKQLRRANGPLADHRTCCDS